MKELIESRQIRAFVAVARRGSFTHGARDVFITQPAASHAIKAMEAELGCKLFRRVGRHALLTRAGERLLAHCENILRNMREARADLIAADRNGHAELRIGAPVTLCQHILPAILSRLQRAHPAAMIEVESGDNPRLGLLLTESRVELAVMIEPSDLTEMNFLPLFSDELQLLMPRDHAWAKKPVIGREEFRATTLIVAHRATQTFQIIDHYFRALQMPLERTLELGSVEAIREMVKSGLGVGIVAPWSVPELAHGELVARPLPENIHLRRNWGIVHRRDYKLTPLEKDFVALCREVVAGSKGLHPLRASAFSARRRAKPADS